MVTATKQYHSFLGGLVGESCQFRTDMDRFGKWFSVADNVRFDDLGSFGNRPGFERIAHTKKNDRNEDIRLLSFQFNDDNSYLIEMSSDVLRFYKNGQLVGIPSDPKTPYELKNELRLTPGKDLKYTQSADVVYICDGTQGIKELRRIKDDEQGFEWEFKDFEFKNGAMPLDYENSDENKTISIANIETSEATSFKTFDVFLKYRDNYPFFAGCTLSGELKTSDGKTTGVTFLTTTRLFYSLSELADYIEKNNLYNISVTKYSESEKTMQLYYEGEAPLVKMTLTVDAVSTEPTVKKGKGDYPIGISHSGFPIRFYYADPIVTEFGRQFETVSVSALAAKDTERNDFFLDSYKELTNEITNNFTNRKWYTEYVSDFFPITDSNRGLKFKKYGTSYSYDLVTEYAPIKTLTYTKTGTSGADKIATSTFDFWSDKEAGDVFGIRHRVSGQSSVLKFSSTGTKEGILKNTGGSWGFISSGAWSGSATLYYSVDGGVSWNEFYRIASNDKEAPQNVNVTGEIEPDGSKGVDLKISVTVDTYDNDVEPAFTLKTDPYETISYFQIVEFVNKESVELYKTKAYVKGIKNDVGEIAATDNWREGVFSNAKGWPTAVGLYQNRLIIAKDWYLYGSKTNDFYDFYEPIELSDDDPVTMSLLSYKVNTIQNISLLKGFFVFTGGGEFNIVSEGALTQKDKNLQQFSSHGSIQALPSVVGNHLIFVDKSGNTVRAMRYVFDADTYEAENVSILLQDNINGEVIKTIEYLSNSHEVLFLTENGNIFVFKFLPEQQIACWSKWNHSRGTITNICVVPNGYKEDLYVAVSDSLGKHIERLSEDVYKDSYEAFLSGPMEEVKTELQETTKVHVTKIVGDKEHYEFTEVGKDGVVALGGTYDSAVIGFPYKTEATLLGPEIIVDQIGGNTVYNRKRPFKAHFIYRKSKGFKVGVKEGEKMEIQWQDVTTSIDDENKLTSGKKSVLVPCRYDGTGRVSFVQEEPFRFEILNACIEVDYGGK